MRARAHRRAPHLLALLLAIPLCGLAAPGAGRKLDARALYGYGPFEEANEAQLESIGEYRATGRAVKLYQSAARAFREMQAAALRDGVVLVPVSGFRERARQRELFRGAVKRHGSQKNAARWVAPPGFSHHEAGLAIDLGDESAPKCDARACFRKTPAYQWLRKNAARFGFELNGARRQPKVKPHEPWHWRYVEPADTEQASDLD